MVFFMPLPKNVLIQYSIEKADQALNTAVCNIDTDLISANNRIYYAIFYIITALSYKDDFTTSSHQELMGWFNKKYIYEEKVFDSNLSKIYTQALRNRQKYDYNIAEFPDKETTRAIYMRANELIETIKAYINQELEKAQG